MPPTGICLQGFLGLKARRPHIAACLPVEGDSRMFSTYHTSAQQTLLRQRNMFALTSAGLGTALIVATGLAATRDREVVLVPTASKRLTVSAPGSTADYLELVTRDAALMLLNRSPENLDYWMARSSKLADPAIATGGSKRSSSGLSTSSAARTSPRPSSSGR
jgi:hypothetical protein